jgi:iron complex outermembrane receptor protein
MFKLFNFVTALLWTTCVSAQTFMVSGHVRRDSDNTPLNGATVEIMELNRMFVTDELGGFRATKVPPGEYTFSVRFLGYEQQKVMHAVSSDMEVVFVLQESSYMTDEVVVRATRADDHTPTTFTSIDKEEIQQQNYGQDLPVLLSWTPSMVTTSDAGAGIGYTGLRIRGTDATRINVTINGIALNDSESQGVFWVNTPDLASSIQSIQIQRGVGTSTNGAGAFGATVNVLTDAMEQEAYAEGSMALGSFNSQRYTLKTGTGLLNDHWAFDGRISSIRSEGYIERASSDLQSYYVGGGYYGNKTIVKAILFGGKEETYQAWYGTDPTTLAINRRFNYAGAIYDETFNVVDYYDNEVDHYQQDHFQLHVSQQLSEFWQMTVSGHFTYGRGYFEQYLQNAAFAGFGLPDVEIGDSTIQNTDAIVRRWLDNKYYGATFSTRYVKDNVDLTIGGALSRYGDARHFGEIIWAEMAANIPIRYQYYDGASEKTDFNIYSKLNYSLGQNWNAFVDLQLRSIRYETVGVDNDQLPYAITDQFNFFNPKVGIRFSVDAGADLYASYGIANREPNRSDYLDGVEPPKSERLGNLELGWRKHGQKFAFESNYYLMHYTDQLVLTGEVSDTGYPIRANVGKSFRTGVELAGTIRMGPKWIWNANLTWSVNKNKDYAVFDENGVSTKRNTTIILSPSWIAGSQLTWEPLNGVKLNLLSKYVGEQFLDNTENDTVMLDDYFVNDIRVSYEFQPASIRSLELGLLINNVFNVKYSSNGYGYGGVPYYFPQAGTNFLAMLRVKI